jgi:hypothetical protein
VRISMDEPPPTSTSLNVQRTKRNGLSFYIPFSKKGRSSLKNERSLKEGESDRIVGSHLREELEEDGGSFSRPGVTREILSPESFTRFPRSKESHKSELKLDAGSPTPLSSGAPHHHHAPRSLKSYLSKSGRSLDRDLKDSQSNAPTPSVAGFSSFSSSHHPVAPPSSSPLHKPSSRRKKYISTKLFPTQLLSDPSHAPAPSLPTSSVVSSNAVGPQGGRLKHSSIPSSSASFLKNESVCVPLFSMPSDLQIRQEDETVEREKEPGWSGSIFGVSRILSFNSEEENPNAAVSGGDSLRSNPPVRKSPSSSAELIERVYSQDVNAFRSSFKSSKSRSPLESNPIPISVTPPLLSTSHSFSSSLEKKTSLTGAPSPSPPSTSPYLESRPGPRKSPLAPCDGISRDQIKDSDSPSPLLVEKIRKKKKGKSDKREKADKEKKKKKRSDKPDGAEEKKKKKEKRKMDLSLSAGNELKAE